MSTESYLSHQQVMVAGDVVLVNYYPYWKHVALEYAVAIPHLRHLEVFKKAGYRPVIISEAGWPI